MINEMCPYIFSDPSPPNLRVQPLPKAVGCDTLLDRTMRSLIIAAERLFALRVRS